MGRQLRRVPLDFNHPLNEVWPGFLNPHYSHCSKCLECDGTGSSAAARYFSDQWYGHAPFDPVLTGSAPFDVTHPAIVRLAERNGDSFMERSRLCGHFNRSWSNHLSPADVAALVAHDRLWDFTRRPRTQEQAALLAQPGGSLGDHGYWLAETNGYTPTAAEVNEWSLYGLGHDSINQSVCVTARCEREGLPSQCTACEGSGEKWDSEVAHAAAEAWEPAEPPIGDGWQMWETVSEGSPISPVFESAKLLADWLGKHKRRDATRDQWFRMIVGSGWAPSGMTNSEGELVSGVAVVGELAVDKP
jgi:hypothetical protein